jgi:hypothetical protein
MATFKNFLGKQQELDPEFKPITAAEALAKFKAIADNAGYNNMTPEEYLISRGGINRSGIYGDSYGINNEDGVSLTDEELDPLRNAGGDVRNAALAKKIFEKTGKLPKWWGTNTPGYTPTIGAGATGGAGGAGGTGGSGAGLVASDGTKFTDQAAFATYETGLREAKLAKDAIAAENLASRTSAYDLLKNEFAQYGMGDLVESVKSFIMAGVSPSEFTMRLRETQPYKTRFKANEDRVKAGLAAISEAEYIGLEDQYQNIMRNYGLPESYYSKGLYGTQEGFQKFIASDVSATELEDRIMTAQERVINSNPEVLASLKAFYPGINNGDILAYTLDPKNALTEIKRKVTAAEIGGAATQAGLKTGMERAQELGAAGITKEQAQQGFQTVAEVAPRGGQLAAMYGESPYTQQTAEQEVFGLAGSVDAAKQRKKLAGLERAEFSGQVGAAQGALGRERAGNF